MKKTKQTNNKISYYECRKRVKERVCRGRVSAIELERIKVPLDELLCPKCGWETWNNFVPMIEPDKGK